MSDGNNKYEKVVKIIRESLPAFPHPELIEDAVIEKIRTKDQFSAGINGLIDTAFGWIYSGWVRRSFIGAALILFAVFVYQQADLLRSVRSLEREVVTITHEQPLLNVRDLERRLTIFKISSKIGPERKIEINESQLKEFMDSYKNLELKYENLNRMIQEDTLLKKYFEKKFEEIEKNKSKI